MMDDSTHGSLADDRIQSKHHENQSLALNRSQGLASLLKLDPRDVQRVGHSRHSRGRKQKI